MANVQLTGPCIVRNKQSELVLLYRHNEISCNTIL